MGKREVDGAAMTITLVGANHTTAPIELRERVHVDAESVGEVVSRLVGCDGIEECVILSTCNRTELYLHVSNVLSGERAALETLAARAGLTTSDAESFIYRHHGYETVVHLFRVAASLDSLVLGEAEILGQIGDAYEAGLQMPEGVGPVLHRLFQSGLAVGGAVRSATKLGCGAASIPSAAVRLAIKVFGSLEGRTAVVLGAGDMGETTLRCLLAEGASDVLVANRTPERAAETVARVGGRAVSMDEFWRSLSSADVLVTSTAATSPVITKRELAGARGATASPLVVLDIALPRDVESAVGELPSVFLYNIDDLQKVVGATHEARAAEVSSAEELIADHARRFWRWYRAREAAPVIRGLRAHAEAIRREEVERLLAGLDGLGDGDRRRIEASMRRMLNKLLHPSTVAVRRAALDPGGLSFLEGLRNALGLAPVPPDEAVAPGGVPAPEDGHGVAAETREEREAGNR